ncbi:MAG: hypothetical protein IJZ00_00450 [Lachnospiraceae bacterium]|nr:hypothetical protein [Lachnospiraceae bacterium]
MIKMEWILTEDLSTISLEEFDNEWRGIIAGHFLLEINQSSVGYCPKEKLQEGEMGLEDVLYWLSMFKEGLIEIKKGKVYEILLLTRNRYNLRMRPEKDLYIDMVSRREKNIKWTECVNLQEFEEELQRNIDKFIQIITETNPQLLKSEWIKPLYEN